MILQTTRMKLAVSAAVVGSAAAVAGLGTFGTFTSTTSASTTAGSGTVQIALGTDGSADAQPNLAVSNLLPGDTMQRAFTLSNTGDSALSALTLTTSATTSSKLDSDATNGLQLTVKSCPTAWTVAGTAPAYTYSCSGSVSTVLASRPVIGSNVALTNLKSLTPNATDHLVATMSFPSQAGNDLQNQSSALTFTFTGVQRVATNR